MKFFLEFFIRKFLFLLLIDLDKARHVSFYLLLFFARDKSWETPKVVLHPFRVLRPEMSLSR